MKVVHTSTGKCKVNTWLFQIHSQIPSYNDPGRDTLEEVYAEIFHTESALVRPQITCGTHALALALLQICARAMSFYLQSENLMTHWKKSLESAHRMVLLRSMEFPIAR